MLKETQKNKIIISYSKVLHELIQKQNKENMIEEMENIIANLGDIIKNEVSPSNYGAYKKAMFEIKKQINTGINNDEIVNFLSFVLQRRYGFLLPSIIEATKEKLRNQNEITKVDVFSKIFLDDKIKNDIKNVIENQIKNTEISFKTNPNISSNSIEFVANGKICVLNLQQITNKILNS